MRVLWWVPELPPDLGGIGTFASELAPHLRRHEVTYLVSHGPEARGVHRGLPVVHLPLIEQFRSGTAHDIMRARRSVSALKQELAADVYHLHLSEPSPVLHVSTAQARPAPTVLTLHNEVLRRLDAGEGTLLRRLFDTAAVITTVSHAVAAHLTDHVPEVAGRLEVIQNGIATGPPPPPLPAEPLVLAMGRLEEQKGFDLLLRALPDVYAHVPGVRVVVAGDGTQGSVLRQLADELGVSGHVDFLGRVGRDRIAELLHEARVVVAPSRWEGLPYALLEAAERGRAIVTTAVGGNVEVVLDGTTGLLVDVSAVEHDPTRLSNALVRALTEPGLAEALGAAARQRVLDHFDVVGVAQRYEDLYERVARQRG